MRLPEDGGEECTRHVAYLPLPWGLTEYGHESMMVTRVLDLIFRALALALEIILHFTYHFPRHT